MAVSQHRPTQGDQLLLQLVPVEDRFQSSPGGPQAQQDQSPGPPHWTPPLDPAHRPFLPHPS